MKNVYTDSVEEYRALRGHAGLLDHDQTGLVAISGADAASFLNHVSTRTVDFLLEGQSSAALLLDEVGTVLAEVIIHRRIEDHLVELWPAQADRARECLLTAAADFPQVTVTDLSDELTVLGVEGPASFRMVDAYLSFPIASLAYRTITDGQSGAGIPLSVSRTGATGEYGYKLIVATEHADALRAELLAAGAILCGSDALDTCRMEMRFVNLEREGDGAALSPFDIGLQWLVDFGHEFTGRQALLDRWESGLSCLPVCWMAEPGETEPATSTPDTGLAVTVDGTHVGYVAHAVYSPALGRVIGTARVDRAVAASGLSLTFDGAGRTVRTTSAPFLVPTSFSVSMQ